MKKYSLFLIGLLAGALLFGGGAAYAASGVLAERSAMPFFVNGAPAEVEAYLINGNNYLKLRDIAALADFGVFWNEAGGTVSIDTMVGYTPEAGEQTPTVAAETAPVSAAVDYSAAANPGVFTADYSREIYNALREAIVTGGDSRTFTMDSEAKRQTCWDVTAAIGTWPGYHLESAGREKSYFTPKYPAPYQEAADYCRPFIDGLAGLSDAEKVRQIAFFVCDRLTYDAGSLTSPREVLISDAVSKGNCMSYAHNFMFLCNMADIPCVFVHSENHQWNEVFVDEKWWSVDVTSTDTGDSIGIRPYKKVLWDLQDVQGIDYQQTQPTLTQFAKELLIPGSTGSTK